MSMPDPTPAPPPKPAPFWWPSLQGFVAVSVVVTCQALVLIRHFHPITVDDKGLDMMVNTFYVLGLAAIIQFLFGSSSQSRAKDETISKLAGVPATPVDTSTTTTSTTVPAPLAPRPSTL